MYILILFYFCLKLNFEFMSRIKIKKGLDIILKGTPKEEITKLNIADYYAVKPTDFKTLIPKIVAKEGAKVKAGTVLFRDKYNEKIVFTSPVSGELTEIKRGERRKILEFIVKADKQIEYEEFKSGNADSFSKQDIIDQLLLSGLWTKIVRRPYGVIPKPDSTPKSIHISTFDSAPLAPNYNFTLKNNIDEFQFGVDLLSKLTIGKVNVNIDATISGNIFKAINNAQINEFEGKHPAGNVGTQIHHTSPINKGENVWTLNPQDVVFIGRLFKTGKLDLTKIVALAGSEVKNPQYYQIISGAKITSFTKDNINDGNDRYISGNVLTGSKIEKTGFIGSFDNLVTIIPEGDEYEMFGWIKPGFKKLSNSRAVLSWLLPKKAMDVNTNLHGGVRAFVLTDELNKVFPWDILPMYLIKAAMAEDIDKLENLGIYEVIEEDFALCEFVNTSKIEIQDVISKTIELMIKEME